MRDRLGWVPHFFRLSAAKLQMLLPHVATCLHVHVQSSELKLKRSSGRLGPSTGSKGVTFVTAAQHDDDDDDDDDASFLNSQELEAAFCTPT